MMVPRMMAVKAALCPRDDGTRPDPSGAAAQEAEVRRRWDDSQAR